MSPQNCKNDVFPNGFEPNGFEPKTLNKRQLG